MRDRLEYDLIDSSRDKGVHCVGLLVVKVRQLGKILLLD